jgi:hypothetical protein
MRDVATTIVSDCGRFSAEIERRPSGSFRISVFKWFEEEDLEGRHEAFWQPVERRVILADMLENAKRLALDEFTALAAQYP